MEVGVEDDSLLRTLPWSRHSQRPAAFTRSSIVASAHKGIRTTFLGGTVNQMPNVD